MKVAVMGAGAVGCYYGGMLAKAGHEVTLIGRPAHIEPVKQRGLLLETKLFKEFVPAKGSTEPSAVAGADLVLVAVKSADTEEAGRSMRASLTANASVLSLQNGVDNAERLGAVIGRQVIPAVVYVGSEMAGPGHVLHHGRGDLVIGTSSTSERIASTLTAAGMPVTVSERAIEALWVKLIINCAYNALSAVGQIAYGPMVASPGSKEVMTNVVNECAAVANSLGVQLPADIVETVIGLAQSMPAQLSSTAQDLARGKPTEIDFLNGYVVRKGVEAGIPTPTNLALQVMVKLAETTGKIAERR